MGLMDKVKQQAEQALAKAQQGVSQGQAKLDQVQARRQADGLLRDLGAAYYAWQRTGGSQGDVDAALKVVDEHVAAHGAIDGADDPHGAADDPQHGAAPGSHDAAPGPAAAPDGGNYSIDSM